MTYPIPITLTKPICLVSGRVFPVGTVFPNAVPHPRGPLYGRAAYLIKSAFESCGFPCDLSVFHDECKIAGGVA